MQKPKLTIGQICYFAMFGNNPGTGNRKFTVHSGKVKGITYDSESKTFAFILEIPFEITQTPKWLHRLFPRRVKVFGPIHELYHHLHKTNVYVANENEVYHDVREAVEESCDLVQIEA